MPQPSGVMHNLLYLLDQWPIPATSGAKVHDKIMLRYLTQDWQSAVACWSDDERDELKNTVTMQIDARLSHVKLSWQNFPLTLFNLLVRRQPIHATEFCSPLARNQVRALIERLQPDIIILSCPKLAALVPLLKQISPARIVVDTHDVQVQRCRSIYQNLSAYNLGERFKQRLLIYSYGIVEKVIYKQVDVAWALKAEDKALLESFSSVATIDIVPNVIDPDLVQDIDTTNTTQESSGVSCVFIGDYSYKPNEQSAFSLMDDFADDRIRATGVTLYLVGVNPSAAMLRQAATMQHVVITGKVADLRTYLRPIDTIFLVPLRSGGGVKRKVIEAMACGCPVITTDIGAEGLALTDGVTAEICRMADFRERTLRLVGDRPRRQRLSEQSQAYIHANFGYNMLRRAVRRSLERLLCRMAS